MAKIKVVRRISKVAISKNDLKLLRLVKVAQQIVLKEDKVLLKELAKR